MDHAAAQAWLDRYVEAWRSNDPADIAGLFAEDVTYRYHPHDEPIVGRDAVVTSWLVSPDEPDAWHAVYTPYAVDGHRVVATGRTTYHGTADEPERAYWNCFLLELGDDGRCRSFTEFYVRDG